MPPGPPFVVRSSIAGDNLSKIAVGVRVQVKSSGDHLNKREGVIIDDTATPDRDCIVKIDLIDTPLSFYWQEIIIL